MSHTPGPWKLVDGSVVDTTNTVIAISGIAQPRGYVPDDDVSWANARLIAAAPDLLEALKKMRDGWMKVEHHGLCKCLLCETDAAIAKAEGQAEKKAEVR